MAGLTTGGPNVDVSLLYELNGLAGRAPDWFDRGVALLGAYGIPLALVLLLLWCWRGARRQDETTAAESFAALVWAPLAAATALLVNMPLREFVARPRPFLQHDGLDVLTGASGQASGFSFVSDHATFTMALGVGAFLAHRRLGLLGIGLALAEGLCRVYLGVHYPTDVVGGFALGTAVVLLLAPLAMALLGPLVRAVARSPHAGWLVRARERVLARPVELAQRPAESDLAA
ncbi:phosphatase PAP2 family protein [Streptomyces sp. NBC_00249]|uniref:phosphatase PAP2 family protein n=1 Tax=Streptomyces sp. NBC_00249 TaxID=2975690 RepID=UPI002250338A|nr:phosphatase PAP2 family protein [Streptomyces sp. NBC_00249]MCX5198800.1 phosphatase PAP2 family protein [Streptomyces sp. NBC_00249]